MDLAMPGNATTTPPLDPFVALCASNLSGVTSSLDVQSQDELICDHCDE
jgi:hypothetical protein